MTDQSLRTLSGPPPPSASDISGFKASLLSLYRVNAPLLGVLGGLAAHLWFNKHEPTISWPLFIIITVAPVLSAMLFSEHNNGLYAAAAYSLFAAALITSTVSYHEFVPSGSRPEGYYIIITSQNELSTVDADLLSSVLGNQGMPKGPRKVVSSERYGESPLNPNKRQKSGWLQYHRLSRPTKACSTPQGVERNPASPPMKDYSKAPRHVLAYRGIARKRKQSSSLRLGVEHFNAQECSCHVAPEPMLVTIPHELKSASKANYGVAVSSVAKASLQERENARHVIHEIESQDITKEEAKCKDLFYHIHLSIPSNGVKRCTAVIAGSATAASVLSNTIDYLIAHPADYARLRAEVDTAFPPVKSSLINSDILPKMSSLNAVVYEVFRPRPPVATSLRRVPAVGMEASNCDDAIICDRNAFIPFFLGPANCAGKPLAMLELWTLVSLLVMHVEMSFADGFDSKTYENSLQDYFMQAKGELRVKVISRERSSAVGQ
ncbi:cytochrome P450 [Leucogyrophana mollusca]|uniref:Cytochrome P450 n=1 Tax=Leucogyrophana mollusca TaxID=85980 RepID=A0ACB8B6U8_9AGAM|nr:cytochrome P450 [Leucogyrophana mollusca]